MLRRPGTESRAITKGSSVGARISKTDFDACVYGGGN
jgi:hypothetical protein